MSLSGFTPEFQALLRQAGVTLEFQSGMNQGLSSARWGRYTDKDLDQNSPFFKLRKQGIDVSGISTTLTSPSVIAGIESKKRGIVSADVQKLYDSILKLRGEEAARGAPDTSPKKGWFQKSLDIISRPGRAVTTGMFKGNEGIEEAQAQGKSFSGWRGFDEFLSGAKAGFTGKETKTGTDILREQVGVKNKGLLFAGGLGIDIAADPLSYVGFGIGKKAVEQGAKIAATKKAAEETVQKLAAGPGIKTSLKQLPTAEKLAEELGIPVGSKVLTPTLKTGLLKQGVTTIDQIGTHLGAQAAKVAQESLATDLARVGMSANKAKTLATRWLNPRFATLPQTLAQRQPWIDLMKATPGLKAVNTIDKTRDVLYAEAKQSATKQLTEILNANLEQQVKRNIRIKSLGLSANLAPIPDTAVKALNAVAKVNPIQPVVKAFNHTFNTGSKFDQELTITNSRAAGKAEQRINIGQRELVTAFKGVGKEDRKKWMNAFTGAPGLANGVLKLGDGSDATDFITSKLAHLGGYIDWRADGSGILSLSRINAYLPKAYKIDTASKVQYSGNPVVNFKKLFMSDPEHFKNIDPQNLLYHLHIGVEKALARDQTMKAIASFGIPLKAAETTRDPVTGQLVREGSAAAKELVNKHGYGPIITKSSRSVATDVDPSYHRYLKDLVFHPDVKHGLLQMVNIIDNYKHAEGFARFYDKALGYFKKAVTLPSPTYHIRNSIGDLFTSYLDGVTGIRGSASYAQAAKVMRSLNPISKEQRINDILTAPVDKTTGNVQNPLEEIAKLLQSTGESSLSGRLVMKKATRWKDVPGQHISAEQIWAAYNHSGLKRGFVATDLEHELKGNPNLPLQLVHGSMQKILDLSQSREDYFRLAHFIDRLKRSKAPSFEEAAKDAAYYVKKFHFDYGDVTETERLVFARAMPFYKFTRFATPLMVQMFFANPGKILNAQKLLNNVSFAQGYTADSGDFLPSADAILPDYMRDLAMLPFMSSGPNTTYFNPGLPSTQIFSQTLGGESNSIGGTAKSILQSLAQSSTPFATTPAELYYGKRVLGGGEIPVADKSGSYFPYLASKTPLTNTAFNKVPGDNGLSSLLSFLSGLGLATNTPGKQKGQLYNERDKILRNRQKTGYKKPKKPSYQQALLITSNPYTSGG
jgi:hypothetical protein